MAKIYQEVFRLDEKIEKAPLSSDARERLRLVIAQIREAFIDIRNTRKPEQKEKKYTAVQRRVRQLKREVLAETRERKLAS